jgi:hypothetical protein
MLPFSKNPSTFQGHSCFQQSQRPFKKQGILTTYEGVEENLWNFPV